MNLACAGGAGSRIRTYLSRLPSLHAWERYYSPPGDRNFHSVFIHNLFYGRSLNQSLKHWYRLPWFDRIPGRCIVIMHPAAMVSRLSGLSVIQCKRRGTSPDGQELDRGSAFPTKEEMMLPPHAPLPSTACVFSGLAPAKSEHICLA